MCSSGEERLAPDLTLGDFGTSYSKIMRPGCVDIIPSIDLRENDISVDVGTGHNASRYSRYTVNELVALALGATKTVAESDFNVLDVGSRDIKYVRVRDGRFHEGDWNAVCAAMAGLTLELLLKHLKLSVSDLRVSDVELGVTCGILGTGAVFDLIADGVDPVQAVSALVRGLALNAYNFCKRPAKIYLSGGLCDAQAFVKSFPCEIIPVGRFVLLDGLAIAHQKGLSAPSN